MSCSRRSFFRGLLSGAAVTPLALSTPAAAESAAPHQQGAWTLRWSGWRADLESDWIQGFWTAVHPDGRRVYSTTGGTVRPYEVGYVFDLTVRPPNQYLTTDSPDADQRASQQGAVDRLTAFLREQPR